MLPVLPDDEWPVPSIGVVELGHDRAWYVRAAKDSNKKNRKKKDRRYVPGTFWKRSGLPREHADGTSDGAWKHVIRPTMLQSNGLRSFAIQLQHSEDPDKTTLVHVDYTPLSKRGERAVRKVCMTAAHNSKNLRPADGGQGTMHGVGRHYLNTCEGRLNAPPRFAHGSSKQQAKAKRKAEAAEVQRSKKLRKSKQQKAGPHTAPAPPNDKQHRWPQKIAGNLPTAFAAMGSTFGRSTGSHSHGSLGWEAMLAVHRWNSCGTGSAPQFACSKNLANPAHIDPFDASRSFAYWVSRYGAASHNGHRVLAWFLFPEHGLAIAIPASGVGISWDGRVVSHCTGHMEEPGCRRPEGEVYSLFVAASAKMSDHDGFVQQCEAARRTTCIRAKLGHLKPLGPGARVAIWVSSDCAWWGRGRRATVVGYAGGGYKLECCASKSGKTYEWHDMRDVVLHPAHQPLRWAFRRLRAAAIPGWVGGQR